MLGMRNSAIQMVSASSPMRRYLGAVAGVLVLLMRSLALIILECLLAAFLVVPVELCLVGFRDVPQGK